MMPYYDQDGVTIYHGDCREVLPSLGITETIITDPVWPNAKAKLAGSDRPYALFAEVARLIDCDRLIIQLGCDSDPRILSTVPDDLPFFRACWLKYTCPTRKGRVLYSGDIAYAFGKPPKSAPGRRVIAGECSSARGDSIRARLRPHREFGRPVNGEHPCPRRLEHVQWLIAKFAEGTVLDPFCGSGTTLVAAKAGGFKAVGIEIEEKFCEMAVKRLAQRSLQFV